MTNKVLTRVAVDPAADIRPQQRFDAIDELAGICAHCANLARLLRDLDDAMLPALTAELTTIKKELYRLGCEAETAIEYEKEQWDLF